MSVLRQRRKDLFTLLLQYRPDTKWVPVLVTNFRFTIFHTVYPIGDLHGLLPVYIKQNQNLVTLEINDRTVYAYDDQVDKF